MQEWEYLILYVFHPTLRSEYIDGSALKLNYKPVEPIEKGKGIFGAAKYPGWTKDLSQCLAYLGAQGWELVSTNRVISGGNNTGEREFIFKRQKEE